jgi:hypothetical protein
MIDAEARRELALRLRRLASGRITNAEYEEPWIHRASDEAVTACFHAGWTLYSDNRTYRLRGRHALPPAARAAVGRCVLFLHSNLPYEWPAQRVSVGGLLRAIVTLGASRKAGRAAWERRGEVSIWPFLRQSDYEAALQRPHYLGGGARAA